MPNKSLKSPTGAMYAVKYHSGHSTETALLHVVVLLDSVYTAADNRRSTVLIGLDVSTAFDTISLDISTDSRVETQFGNSDSAHSWLCLYLSSRQQLAKLGQHSAAVMPCDLGGRATGLGPWTVGHTLTEDVKNLPIREGGTSAPVAPGSSIWLPD